jgi:hypothetical protein
MTEESFEGRLSRWFCGNESAVNFAFLLWEASQEWDDLHDEGEIDNPNGLIAWFAFGKEYHPYFMQHGHILRPAMLGMYLSWTAANVLDRGDRRDVEKSYMLRASFYQVLHMIAWIEGGHDHAVAAGPEIFRTYGETVDEIEKEFANA